MLGRAWKVFWEGVDGLKTLAVAAVFFLLGLAEYLDVVNLRPILSYYLGEDKAAFVAMFIPVVFALLRFVSSGPQKWSRRWREENGPTKGGIDVPDGEA